MTAPTTLDCPVCGRTVTVAVPATGRCEHKGTAYEARRPAALRERAGEAS